MEALRETFVIAGQDLKGALRSVKGGVLLALYALASLASGAVVVAIQAKIASMVDTQLGQLASGMDPAKLAAEKHKAYLSLVTKFVGDEKQAAYLISIPIIVFFFFWVSRTFLPLLIALMSYDQIDGEIQSRGLRFVLLRSRRGSVVAGKLLSNMVLFLGITVITNLLLVGFAMLRVPGFQLGEALPPLVRFWLLTLPLGLCFVALMSWFSSLFRSPYLALIIGLLVMFVAWVLGWVAGHVHAIHWIRWAIPFTYNELLTSHLISHQLLGAGAYLGFAALFALLSWVTLRGKDL